MRARVLRGVLAFAVAQAFALPAAAFFLDGATWMPSPWARAAVAAITSMLGGALSAWVLTRATAGRRLTVGGPAALAPLTTLLVVLALGGLITTLEVVGSSESPVLLQAVAGILPIAATLIGASLVSTARSIGAVAAETAGLNRTVLGSLGLGVALLGTIVLASLLAASEGQGPSIAFDMPFGEAPRSVVARLHEAWLGRAERHGLRGPYEAALAGTVLGLGVAVFATWSAWWLVPARARSSFWAVFDTLATAAMMFALWALPFVPDDGAENVQLPALALGITAVFATRAYFRLIPASFDRLEALSFDVMVAARMLRAKKSGFLTVIGVLSILAVSFSSCTLSTTLSVMGGFRADLQQKILGNRAHVLVDRLEGPFAEWRPTLELVRGVPGVRGASPYVGGEVMLTSAIESPAGGELRGIDPVTVGEATDLVRNMESGSLEYLVHPELLVQLSFDALREGRIDSGEPESIEELLARPMPEGPAATGGLVGSLDALLDELPGASAPARRNEPVLPGIILGRELASSMRLHVGDEVNAISPNGDLGPTGPLPRARAFRVAGIFYTGMFEYDMRMAYTDLATAQSFLRTGDAVTGIEARLADWQEADPIAVAVREAIGRGDLRVRSWREVNRNLFGALELEKLAMFITLGIAILVASFCIFAALVLMVQEKGREVAILKAMGCEDRTVIRVFMLQGLFVGLVGASSGLGLGYLLCFAAEHLRFIRMNPEVYYIDRLPVAVDATEFTWVGVAAVLVCVAATVYPAVLGGRLRPVEALRRA